MGVTQAFFHSSTYSPFLIERLNIQVNGGPTMSADILRALAGMLSNPVDFEILRLRNSSSLISENLKKKIGVGSRPGISASKRICVEGIIFSFSCKFCPDIDKKIIKSLRFQFIV